MLRSPDQRTRDAFRRLQHDGDFMEIVAWLQVSLADLDASNRQTLDASVLRMGQGAAQALSEMVDYANGKSKTSAQPLSTSPQ